MIRLKHVLFEIEQSIQQKLDTIPENVKVNLGNKIRKWHEDRSRLTQGSGGMVWHGLNVRMTNIEKVLEAMGFLKVRDSSGETEIDKAIEWLYRYSFTNKS